MNGWHPVVMSELGIDTVEAVQTGWDAFRAGDVEVVPEQEIGSATGWLWVPGMDHNPVPVAVPIRRNWGRSRWCRRSRFRRLRRGRRLSTSSLPGFPCCHNVNEHLDALSGVEKKTTAPRKASTAEATPAPSPTPPTGTRTESFSSPTSFCVERPDSELWAEPVADILKPQRLGVVVERRRGLFAVLDVQNAGVDGPVLALTGANRSHETGAHLGNLDGDLDVASISEKFSALTCSFLVELPGIEPGSYGMSSRLLRAQSATSFSDLPVSRTRRDDDPSRC